MSRLIMAASLRVKTGSVHAQQLSASTRFDRQRSMNRPSQSCRVPTYSEPFHVRLTDDRISPMPIAGIAGISNVDFHLGISYRFSVWSCYGYVKRSVGTAFRR